MSIKKQYSKTSQGCKVTFRLSKEIVELENHVTLVGDFNDWNTEITPMKKAKNEEFTISINLENGHEYQFKYLVNGVMWVNDDEADKYAPDGFRGENSVIVL